MWARAKHEGLATKRAQHSARRRAAARERLACAHRSWPAVSQICALMVLPSTCTRTRRRLVARALVRRMHTRASEARRHAERCRPRPPAPHTRRAAARGLRVTGARGARLDAASGKLHANCGLGLEAEFVAREPRQQVGLAHAGVANEHHLEQVVVAARRDGERGNAAQFQVAKTPVPSRGSVAGANCGRAGAARRSRARRRRRRRSAARQARRDARWAPHARQGRHFRATVPKRLVSSPRRVCTAPHCHARRRVPRHAVMRRARTRRPACAAPCWRLARRFSESPAPAARCRLGKRAKRARTRLFARERSERNASGSPARAAQQGRTDEDGGRFFACLLLLPPIFSRLGARRPLPAPTFSSAAALPAPRREQSRMSGLV
jgi:hypothetical protein